MRTPKIRHLRHRTFERTRHSKHLLSWLAAQAARLEVTAAEVFDSLVGGSAVEVEATPTPVGP